MLKEKKSSRDGKSGHNRKFKSLFFFLLTPQMSTSSHSAQGDM